jgi:hypothetical protein
MTKQQHDDLVKLSIQDEEELEQGADDAVLSPKPTPSDDPYEGEWA